MKVLLFVGAGASAELGIPTMRPMTKKLVAYLRRQDVSEEIVSVIQEKLDDAGYDMEGLIGDVDAILRGREATRALGLAPGDKQALDQIVVLKQEIEWFIHYLCEGIVTEDALQLWKWTLQELEGHDVTIATTNYDRGIELAMDLSTIELNDGFVAFEDNEYAVWNGLEDGDQNLLLKLHGSTDWYRSPDGRNVYKLRHPMPLYGELEIRFPSEEETFSLRDAAVLPSREKTVREQPYDGIRLQFQLAARNADVAIFIGSSFRDPDLESVFQRCASRTKTYIVDQAAEPSLGELEPEVEYLQLTASQFLCSVFPCALVEGDLSQVEEYASRFDGQVVSVLDRLVVAQDTNKPDTDRCDAIEWLVDKRVSLVGDCVSELLSDESEEVAKFGLGLVTDSPNADSLLDKCEEIASDAEGSSFRKELEYLKEFSEVRNGAE